MVTNPAPLGPPATVWVVAGAPGVGKSTVAGLLVARVQPTPALLDKDTLFADLAGQVLAAYGRAPGEREGPWYDEHVKRHEYAALTGAAREIRRPGCPVTLVAPFTEQIRSPARWRRWVADLGGEPVVLVWVGCDAGTLRARLVDRARARDSGKLGDFDTFVARTQPDTPPPVRHLAVWTSADAEPLDARVAQVAQGGGRRAAGAVAPPGGSVTGMLEPLAGLPQGVLGFEAVGEVHSVDYEQTLAPAVSAAAAHGGVRLVYVLGERFTGYSAGAGWQDLRLGIGSRGAWQRAALVSDLDWVRHLSAGFGWMFPGELRHFALADLGRAIAWAAAGPEAAEG